MPPETTRALYQCMLGIEDVHGNTLGVSIIQTNGIGPTGYELNQIDQSKTFGNLETWHYLLAWRTNLPNAQWNYVELGH